MLEFEGIIKTYGPARVLDNVSLTLPAGQIHAVVGENGAGKSTLTRIAAGLVRQDRGRVLVAGEPIRSASPRAARSAGVGIVTQELTSVPARTVLENVFLGVPVAGFGSLRRSPAAREYDKICEETGFWLPPDAVVRDLSLADQQILEVLRCLARRPRVLIMDEPTSSLDESRADQLLALLRRLSEQGVAVMFVSHLLREVLATTDTVTVLRDGVRVSTEPTAEESEVSLIQKMVGRPLGVLYGSKRLPAADAKVVLQASDIWRGKEVSGVSLTIKEGEIVGLAGLIGAGRSEFARCLIGAERCDRGSVRIADGKPLRPRHPRETIGVGLLMVPEDRKGQGLILGRSVAENLALSKLRGVGHWGFALPRWLEKQAQEWVTRSDIRPRNPSVLVQDLSGGNQQKVLLSKWLACDPKVLIADEPTRGVDVGAKVTIHQMIIEAAATGIGVLLISSEIEELIGLAHRILVFRKGTIVGEFEEATASRERIIAAAFGTAPDRAAL
ncbi:MAG: sugar ABC transporter ATP-binding protein [Acidimicrobiales bacterium]